MSNPPAEAPICSGIPVAALSDLPVDLQDTKLPFAPTPTQLHPMMILDQILQESEELGENEILRASDFLLPKSMVDGALSILDRHSMSMRRMVCGKRSIYTVRGTTKRRNDPPRTYFCQARGTFWHCSCRSFIDRARRNPQNICKHLLAIKLAPYLGVTVFEEERSETKTWAKSVIGCISQKK